MARRVSLRSPQRGIMYFHNSPLRDYKNTVKVKILQDFVQMLRHMCVLLHKVHCEVYFQALETTFLPLVFYLLGKTKQIFYIEHCTVIEHCPARKAAEHLMLIALEKLKISTGGSVDHRNEVHFEAAVVA